MKIGICEDNADDAELLLKLIQELPDEQTTDLYHTSEQLLEAYSKGTRYDLVFMDIQMPGTNGFEAAHKIYNEHYGERPLITFLTVSNKYVFNAYNVGWDYIYKPITKDRLRQLFSRAQTELSHRKVTFRTTDGVILIETKDILYIDSFKGHLNIVTKQVTYNSRLTFEEVLDILDNSSFCKIHRCCIINLRHVSNYTNTEVIISNEYKIPISRNRRKPFLANLENYLSGNYYG